METKTVKETQTIAKERGLQGYSKLRKADLLAVLATGLGWGRNDPERRSGSFFFDRNGVPVHADDKPERQLRLHFHRLRN